MDLRARDVMTADVTTVRQDTPASDLIKIFRESHFTGIPVVDAEGKAVGLVSETDILRALAYALTPPPQDRPQVQGKGKGKTSAYLLEDVPENLEIGNVIGGLLRRTVQELMTPVLVSCRPDEPLAGVCETMSWKEVHRIVVTDEAGKVLGLISSLSMVSHFGEHLRKGSE